MSVKKFIFIFQHLTLAISLLIAGAVIFFSIAAHAEEKDINNEMVSKARQAWVSGDKELARSILADMDVKNGNILSTLNNNADDPQNRSVIQEYGFGNKLSEENLTFLMTLSESEYDAKRCLGAYVGTRQYFDGGNEDIKDIIRQKLEMLSKTDPKSMKSHLFHFSRCLLSPVDFSSLKDFTAEATGGPNFDLGVQGRTTAIIIWQSFLDAFSDEEVILLFGLTKDEINDFLVTLKAFESQKNLRDLENYAREILKKADKRKEEALQQKKATEESNSKIVSIQEEAAPSDALKPFDSNKSSDDRHKRETHIPVYRVFSWAGTDKKNWPWHKHSLSVFRVPLTSAVARFFSDPKNDLMKRWDVSKIDSIHIVPKKLMDTAPFKIPAFLPKIKRKVKDGRDATAYALFLPEELLKEKEKLITIMRQFEKASKAIKDMNPDASRGQTK